MVSGNCQQRILKRKDLSRKGKEKMEIGITNVSCDAFQMNVKAFKINVLTMVA